MNVCADQHPERGALASNAAREPVTEGQNQRPQVRVGGQPAVEHRCARFRSRTTGIGERDE